MRTRTSILPLVALTVACAMTLAFGFTDASALSVTTPSVTVYVNETGVAADAGAVSVRSPATPAPVARPPADPVPVDPPVVNPPVVDEAPTIRPTRPPASFATQSAEVPSEVAQAATEQNAYAGRPELDVQSTPAADAGHDDGATADTRPSGAARPDGPPSFEPVRAHAPWPSVVARTPGGSSAEGALGAAPIREAPHERRGDRRSRSRGKPRDRDPDGTAHSPVPPLAAPSGGGSASAASGGGGGMAATLVVLLGFSASSAHSLLRTRKRIRRAPDVARALERPG